jgi:hypothetical protein
MKTSDLKKISLEGLSLKSALNIPYRERPPFLRAELISNHQINLRLENIIQIDLKEKYATYSYSDYDYTITYKFNSDLTFITAKIYKQGVEQKVKIPDVPTNKKYFSKNLGFD